MVCWTIPPLSYPSYPFIGSSIYRWCPVRFPSYEPKKSLNLYNLMVINWYVVLDWCCYNHGLNLYILDWYVEQGKPPFFSMSHEIFPKARSWGGFWATPTVPKRRARPQRRRLRRERRQRFGRRRFGENDGKFAMVWGRWFLGYLIVRQTIPNSRDVIIIFSAMPRAPQLFYWCM